VWCGRWDSILKGAAPAFEYYGLAMAQTLKCPSCGVENEPDARKCGKCRYYLKSELECLRSIDRTVGIVERILIWWVLVAFLGGSAYLAFRGFR
jgi:hypothetical protein